MSIAESNFTVSPTEITYTYGETQPQIVVTTDSPEPYTLVSADTNIATVDASGTISYVGQGTTTITVTQPATEFYTGGTTVVNLTTIKYQTNYSVSPTDITYTYGQIQPRIIVTTDSPEPYTFVSANTDIATVATNGTITYVGQGTTTITVNQPETAYYTGGTTVVNLTTIKYQTNYSVLQLDLSIPDNSVQKYWAKIGQDIDGEAAYDYSGQTVSISADGTIIAIGAPNNDGSTGTDSGHVRVYKNINNVWTQLGQDIDGEAAGNISANEISLNADGTIVAIGAHSNDDNGTNSGQIRVYQYINNVWTQVGQDINGESANDLSGAYGLSINADGTIVAIGAHLNDGSGIDAGQVRVYKIINNVWTKIGQDIDGEAANDNSGISVSLNASGTIVAIGAVLNDGNGSNSGHVRVYQYNGTNAWIKIGQDIDGEATLDQSGRSVSLSADGTIVAIGAIHNDGNGSNSGHVRVYQYNGTNTWIKIGQDIDGEAADDNSGARVSLSADGSIVAIGAMFNDGNGTNSGHARIYKNINNVWTKIGQDIDGEAANDVFGTSIALSADGKTVVIGARQNDGNGADSGHARVYYFYEPLLDASNITYTYGEQQPQIIVTTDSPVPYTLVSGDTNIATVDTNGLITYVGEGTTTITVNQPETNYYTAGGTTVINLTTIKYQTNYSVLQVDTLIGHNTAPLSWGQLGQDINGKAADDQSGWSVALSTDGLTVAIGALNNDDNGSNSGHARIYKYLNSTWTKIGQDIIGEAASDNFGSSIALNDDGSIVAIGGYNNDGTGLVDSGHVRIYQYSNGTWIKLGQDIDGKYAYEWSGGTVSLSADGLIVSIGAQGNAAGHARIYQYSNGSWIQIGQDIVGEASGDYFGQTTALSSNGQVIAIGASRNSGGGTGTHTGHVRVYENLNGTWTKIGQDIDGAAAANYAGGSALAISDNGQIIAFGALGNDSNGTDSGHTRIYQNLNGTWTKLGQDIVGEAAGDNSGRSVSLSADGTTVVIGANLNDGNGSNSGHARIYKYINGTWTKIGQDIDGEAINDNLGMSCSISADGTIVAIGAHLNDGNGSNSGHVRVYKYNDLVIAPTEITYTYGETLKFIVSTDSPEPYTFVSADTNIATVDASGTITYVGEGTTTITVNQPATAYYTGGTSVINLTTIKNSVYIVSPTNITYTYGETQPQITVTTSSPEPYTFVSANTDIATVATNGTITYVDQGTTTITVNQPATAYHTGGTTVVNLTTIKYQTNYSVLQLDLSIPDNSVQKYWTKIGQDIDGEAAYDYSGQTVSISADGTIIAIGAPNNDGSTGTDSGHVRVYKNINNVWTQLGQDIDGEAAGNISANEISLNADGTIVAIGAHSNDDNGTNSGQVRVYQYINNVWTQVGQDINGESANDLSGAYAISINADGTIVAIGAHLNDGSGTDSGHVRVYKNINNVWTKIGQDIDGEATNDNSGISVALNASGTIVAIGAVLNDGNGSNSGHARVYQYNGTNAWIKIGQDIDGESGNDQSGRSVSLSADGTIVAIGAINNDGNGADSGHVRVYQYNGTNTWIKIGQDIDGEASGDNAGARVSLSADGSIVAIGVMYNDGNGTNSGHARIYKNINNVWTKIGQDIDGEAANDLFGTSIALSADGKTVVIGARQNDGNGADSGHVRVYYFYEPLLDASNITYTYGEQQPQIIVTTSSPVPYTLVSGDTNIATVATNGLITYVGEGTTTITVNQPETNYYTAGGTTVINLTTIKNSVYSVSPTNITYTYGETQPQITVTTSSPEPYTIVSANTDIATVATNGLITYVGQGTTTITVNQPATAYHTGGTTVVNLTTIKNSVYSVSSTNITYTYGETQPQITVTTSSPEPYTFVSANTDIATVATNGLITYVDQGTTTITVNQPATAYHTGGTTVVNLSTIKFQGNYSVLQIDPSIADNSVQKYWTKIGQDIDGEAAADECGFSVSMNADGSIVAIGARYNDGSGSNAGHVRVYQKINNVWTKIGQDIDGEATNDNSGWSVSLSTNGSIVAIGAVYNDGNGSNSGHVRVYQNINNIWTKIGQDIDGESVDDENGFSVSLNEDGTIVAIGARLNDGYSTNSGHVRVYQNINNVWTKIGQDIDGESVGDESGCSVSLNKYGNIVAIGARYNDGNGTDSGHVRVYQNINNVWLKMGQDIDGAAASNRSGWTVSLSSIGNIVAIGAPLYIGKGQVRVFQFVNNVWTQIGQDIVGEGSNDYSGWSISLNEDGTMVAIGAIYNDGNGTDSGHVRVYKNINNVWTQIGLDIDGEVANDQSGYSVSLSKDGKYVAIGAVYNDGNSTNSGHVRVYKLYEPLIDVSSNIVYTYGETQPQIFISSLSPEPITTTYSTENIVSVLSNGKINYINSGSTIMTIYQEETAFYTGGTTVINVTTNKGSNVLNVSPTSISYTYVHGEESPQLFVIKDTTETISFTSADTNIVSVSDYGKITYINPGTTTITVNHPETAYYNVDTVVVNTTTIKNESEFNVLIRDNSVSDNQKNWVQLGQDIDGLTVSEYSGWSVSMSSDGNVVAIGSPQHKAGFDNPGGCTRVYKNINGVWTLMGQEIFGEVRVSQSGNAVALNSNGTIVSIGARLYNSVGQVRVFQYNEEINTWVQLGQNIVGTGNMDELGYSVAISDDGFIVATGSINNDGNGTDSGNCRVYQYSNNIWTQIGQDIKGEAVGDKSGWSVALSSNGTIVVIGAVYNDGSANNAGQARVYQNINNVWTKIGQDIDGEAADDQSGFSVSINSTGSIVAISSIYNDGNGNNAGHVRVYQYNGINTWTKIGQDIDGPGSGNASGYSVSLSSDGSIVAIGIPYASPNGTSSGKTKIYKNINNVWTQLGIDINGEAITDNSGWTVSLSSDGLTVAIGAPSNDKNFPVDYYQYGHVRVYKFLGPLITASDISYSYGEQPQLLVTTNSPGPYTLVPANSNIVTVNTDGLITYVNPGTTIITVNQPETAYYTGGNSVINITTNKNSEFSVSPTNITYTYGETQPQIIVTTSSPEPYTIVSANTNIATVDINGLITYVTPGTTTITVNQPETIYHIGGTSVVNLTTIKYQTNYSVSPTNITYTYGETPPQIIVTTDSPVPYTLVSANTNIATVAENGTITYVNPGTTTITVNQPTTNYYTAGGTTVVNLTTIKSPSNLTLSATNLTYTYGDVIPNLTISTISDATILYSSSNSSVVSINNSGAMTIQSSGSATITVRQNTTNKYLEDSKQVQITIVKAIATMTTSETQLYTDTIIKPQILPTTNSDGNVLYSSSNSQIVSVNTDGIIQSTGNGTATITVYVLENNHYFDASASVFIYSGINYASFRSVPNFTINTLLDFGLSYSKIIYLSNISISDVNTTEHITNILSENVPIQRLITIGGTILGLYEKGVSINQFISAGYTITNLIDAGITMYSLVTDGITKTQFDTVNRTKLINTSATETNLLGNQLITESIWVKIGQDIDGESGGNESGCSVALNADGTIVAIGANKNSGNGSNSGHVRVYQVISGTWTKIGQDIDGEVAGDWSGYSVSINADGNIVAIGAVQNDGNGNNSGHVRVYQNINGTWTKIGQDIDGEGADDWSGHSVSLNNSGNILAIGAQYNNGNGADSGHIRVYQYNGTNAWNKIGQDIDGEASGDRGGAAVSLSADGLIVAMGIPYNDSNGSDSGCVKIYNYLNGTWTQLGQKIVGEAAYDYSGWSLSLSANGNIVAIGAYGNDGNGSNSGHVRVYQYNGSNTWTQIGQDINGEYPNDFSSYEAVSLSDNGNIVAIGAYGNDGNGSNSGHVRVYKNINNVWTQIGQDFNGEGGNDYFGYKVSLSANGSTFASGAPLNDGNGADSGHVRVYKYIEPTIYTTYTQYMEIGLTITELLNAGLSFNQLYIIGCPLIDGINEGLSLTDFKTIPSFTTSQLISLGVSYATLITMGLTSTDTLFNNSNTIPSMLTAGITVETLISIGVSISVFNNYTLTQLINYGVKYDSLLFLGYTLNTILNSGFTNTQLINANVPISNLLTGEVDIAALISQGATVESFKDANYTISQLKPHFTLQNLIPHYTATELLSVDFTVEQLQATGLNITGLNGINLTVSQLSVIGFTPSQLKYGGFNASQIRLGGITDISVFQQIGFTTENILVAGFSASVLKTANYTATQLKPYYTIQQLYQANYSITNLKNAGYTISQIYSVGYTNLDDLIAAQFNATELKSVGFSALQLKNKNFSLNQLYTANYSVSNLKTANYTISQLKGINISDVNLLPVFSVAEFKAANYTALQLRNYNFTLSQLYSANYSVINLKNANYTCSEIKTIGYTNILDYAGSGFTALQFRLAGFTTTQLKLINFTSRQLIDGGYSLTQLIEGGYDGLDVLKQAGLTVSQILNINNTYTTNDFKTAGYTVIETKNAGYNINQLYAGGYNSVELKSAGYTLSQLYTVGFSVANLKQAGFNVYDLLQLNITVSDLIRGGYTLSQLRYGGVSALQLKNLKYTASQLHSAGYTAKQLQIAGYSDEIIKATYTNLTPDELIDLGFTAETLYEEVANLDELKQAGYTINDLSTNNITIDQLVVAGFSSVDLSSNYTVNDLAGLLPLTDLVLGYSVADLSSAGYTVEELIEANIPAKKLAEANYSITDLSNAGYTFNEIVSGFSVETLIESNFTLSEIASTGQPVVELTYLSNTYTISDLSNIGFSATQLKVGGFDASSLFHSNIPVQNLKEAGFTATELKNAGVSATELINSNYDVSDLLDAEFSIDEIKATDISVNELLALNVPIQTIVNAGYTATQLVNANVSVAQLKDLSFSATQLIEANVSVSTLLSSTFSTTDLKNANIPANELLDIDVPLPELKIGGYTVEEVETADPTITVDELKNSGYSAIEIITDFSNISELRNAGITINDISSANIPLSNLISGGYTSTELSTIYTIYDLSSSLPLTDIVQGFSYTDLSAAGYSFEQLISANIPAKSLADASYSIVDISNAGYGLNELASGFSVDELLSASFTLESIANTEQPVINLVSVSGEYTVQDLSNIGFSTYQLKTGGFDASSLYHSGVIVSELKTSGFTATELKAAGVSATELKTAGYSLSQLLAANFTYSELKAAEYTASQLKTAGVSNTNLKTAGYTASQLKTANLSAKQLKDINFTATQLKTASFTASQLKTALFTVSELKTANYPLTDIISAGYLLSEIKTAGYTATQLKTASPSITDATLKSLGYVVADLKVSNIIELETAGISISDISSINIPLETLVTAGYTVSDLSTKFSVVQLAQVVPLTDVVQGFSYSDLSNAGYSFEQLVEANIPAKKLAEANYSIADVSNAGYTLDKIVSGFAVSDLLSANISLETIAATNSPVVNLVSLNQQYSVQDLSNIGFSVSQLKSGGFDASALYHSNIPVVNLKNVGYTPVELKQASIPAIELKTAGFELKELKQAQFNAVELKTAEYYATDLITVGFTAADIKPAGFEASDIHTAGYLAYDLKLAGFTASQLK